ncbi:hypothetical protein ACFC25_15935 [Pseudarthrobacter sp. NPDC055928]|uniref:hypothetical protein n=1 Tax=unclassified Pseudarthrobacter TaxID=2647000 RepID=UPI003077E27F
MGKSGRGLAVFARLRTAAAFLVLATVATGLSGCRDVFAPPPCMPPAYTVTPSEAKPGEQVTVSAQDTNCDARYGQNAQVQVTVRDAFGSLMLEELAPMSDDGAFTFVFTVPPGAAPGKAAVGAHPYNLDWCDDTGVNNRAGAGPRTLVLVSCAERLVPLLILAGTGA